MKSGFWSAQRPWPAQPVPENPESETWDRYHINSLGHDGEAYVLSCFTLEPKPRDQRWRCTDLTAGAILRWKHDGFADEPIAKGVYAPHSVRLHEGFVWWCDSFRGRVCRCDGWSSPHLGGFARGLRIGDDQLIVGLSKSRVAPNPTLDVCGVALIDPVRPEDPRIIPLGDPYIEVYDVMALRSHEWPWASQAQV